MRFMAPTTSNTSKTSTRSKFRKASVSLAAAAALIAVPAPLAAQAALPVVEDPSLLGAQFLPLACDLEDQSRWFTDVVSGSREAFGLSSVAEGQASNREPIGFTSIGTPIFAADTSSNTTNFIAGDGFTPVPANTVSPFIVHGNKATDTGVNGVADPYTTHVRLETYENPMVGTHQLGSSRIGHTVAVPDVLSWRIRVVTSSLDQRHGNNTDSGGLRVGLQPKTMGLCLTNNSSGLIRHSITEYERYRDNPVSDTHYFDGTPVDTFRGTAVDPVWQDAELQPEIEAEVLGETEVNPDSVTCAGQVATIVGTEGADNLVGTSGPDIIVGLGGNDTIRGLGGNDIICGNGGNDVIGGNYGNDRIYGGVGDDVLNGGVGNDSVGGGFGNDKLYGYTGEDSLFGSAGNDEVFGGGGDDVIRGGDGTDRLLGGFGADTIHGGNGADIIRGEVGNDVIFGNNGDDDVNGNAGNDRVYGGNGADLLFGGRGADVLHGGVGEDQLRGSVGNDRIAGGQGNDRIWGGDGNDVLRGSLGDDVIFGGNGNDDINGEDGEDAIRDTSGRNRIVQ